MKKLFRVASIVLFASSGWATTLTYTLQSELGYDAYFTSLQVPEPQSCTFGTGCFSISPAFLIVNGGEVGDPIVNFYLSGGLTILAGHVLLVNNGGPVLFNGGVTDPVLKTLSNLRLVQQSFGHPQDDDTFILSAKVSPLPVTTPEPGTWELGGLALALFTFVRNRKTQRSISA